MTKVALVVPGKDRIFAVQEPLNIGYIASYLEKNDIDVTIIDQLAGQNVKKEIRRFQPDIVGVTATTPLVNDAYEIIDMCKEMGLLTVMGGRHASILPEEAIKHADIVVKGEGEIAMADIVKNNIKSGIVSRHYIKDLDSIPPPARHLMQMEFYLRTKDRMQESYLYFVPLKTRVAGIISSRGCPFDCAFCHNSWKGLPFRFHSPERVIFEIKYLLNMYDIEAIFFLDDNLFANKPRLKKICKLMKENEIDIIWGCNSRVDNVDAETLRLVKEVGCKQITFGFESGSQRILNILNKRTTVEKARQAIKLCKEVGLFVTGTFMIGNPTETIEDVKLTQRFITENEIDDYGVCITTPFPGTKLWQWCEENGLIPENFNWSDFTYRKIPIRACNTISAKEIEELYLETAYLKPSKGPVRISSLINTVLSNPFTTTKHIIKHPSRVINTIKNLRL
jgi:radical SAM superfamily enzyme YgiQ (UPF0313 family)